MRFMIPRNRCWIRTAAHDPPLMPNLCACLGAVARLYFPPTFPHLLPHSPSASNLAKPPPQPPQNHQSSRQTEGKNGQLSPYPPRPPQAPAASFKRAYRKSVSQPSLPHEHYCTRTSDKS